MEKKKKLIGFFFVGGGGEFGDFELTDAMV